MNTAQSMKINQVFLPAYQAFQKETHPIIFLGGGRGAGRSFVISDFLRLLFLGIKPYKTRILLLRNVKSALKDSLWLSLTDTLASIGITQDHAQVTAWDQTRTTIEYNGHRVTANSLNADVDSGAKLKSLKDYTHIFIEEMQEAQEAKMFDQLMTTVMRPFETADGHKVNQTVVCAFNTPPVSHWITTSFFDLEPTEHDGFYKPIISKKPIEDFDGLTWSDIIHYTFATYQDNHAYLNNLYEQGEKHAQRIIFFGYERFKTKDPYTYLTETLGLVATGKSGRIFNDWQKITKADWDLIDVTPIFGVDFGYTNDPTAVTGIKKKGNTLYIHNFIYKVGLNNINIYNEIKKQIPNYEDYEFICDSSEPKSVADLQLYGIDAIPAVKGNGSRKLGVDFLLGFDVFYTEESNYKVNGKATQGLDSEVEDYSWVIDKTGKNTNEPSDGNDHCFTGDTLITTNKGEIPMKDIKVGDLVLTRKGFKKVLIKHKNGIKDVLTYRIVSNIGNVCLRSTSNHKIWTQNGWKQIKYLQPLDTIYQLNSSMANGTIYNRAKDILNHTNITYIEKFGNFIMRIFQKVFTFTIKTIIYLITKLRTLSLSQSQTTIKSIGKNGTKMKIDSTKCDTTLSSMLDLKLQNGINQMKVELGTKNITKKLKTFFTKILGLKIVRFVIKNLLLKHTTAYSAQTLVNLPTEEKMVLIMKKDNVLSVTKPLLQTNIVKSKIVVNRVVQNIDIMKQSQEEVFDLTIEDEHEYFANGVLAHNCLDSVRYAVYTKYHPTNINQLELFYKNYTFA